jgi:toxin-antitoxin system PIN domain toxin
LILVDANILLYAEDDKSPRHNEAREWWDAQLSGTATVCLCWTVINAFTRIGTNPRIFESPLSLAEAIDRIQSWLEQPCVRVIVPTNRHWELIRTLLVDGNASANLVTDAHLAALAMEYGCVLYSTDSDFSRFTGLKWKNPIKKV